MHIFLDCMGVIHQFHRGALIYVRMYQSNEKEFGVRVQLLT